MCVRGGRIDRLFGISSYWPHNLRTFVEHAMPVSPCYSSSPVSFWQQDMRAEVSGKRGTEKCQ